ncbi:MAG: hypothetical protein JXR96_06530 [Deltaproteobacteria bacterium]|nr:hypothetical protein [Deltaproteobacteria bacterium]
MLGIAHCWIASCALVACTDSAIECLDGLVVDGACYAFRCPDRACAPDAVCSGGICVQIACLGKECPAGQACAGGACYSKDCEIRSCPGLGEVCVDGACQGASCVGVECQAGERCAAGRCYTKDCETGPCGGYGEVCVDGECTQASCVGVDCPAGELCAGGRCYFLDCDEACVEPAEVCKDGERCESRACVGVTCRTGRACANGHCLPEDCQAEDCVDGEVCEDGQCVVAACVGIGCPDGQGCARGACFETSCGQTICEGEQVCYQDSCTEPLCVGMDCGKEICVQGRCERSCPPTACTLERQCDAYECLDGIFLCGYDAEQGEPGWSEQRRACHDGDACTIDDSCEAGSCQGTMMACEPPPPICDGNTQVTYWNGICTDGACAYDLVRQDCQNGCLEGSCLGDPCTGGPCDTNETCVDGVCRCGGTGPDCAGTIEDSCCGTSCVDLTEDVANCGHCGRVCSQIPTPWCDGADRVTHQAACVDADCQYPQSREACPHGCEAGECLSGESCEDDEQNGEETDIDCGGPSCPACQPGQACVLARDCTTGICTGGLCMRCGLFQGPYPPAVTSSVAITGNTDSEQWHVYPEGSAADVPEAVSADDHAYAVADVQPSKDSLAFRCTDFGFDLPAGAVVSGIELRLLRATSGTVTNHDLVVQLLDAGEPAGDNRADTGPVWPDASVGFARKTYGGPDDLWGASWTAEAVEDLGFGIQIATHNHWSDDPSTAYIDAVDILVHYCTPGEAG